MRLLVIYKLLICFSVSLAYFSFSNLMTKEIQEIVQKNDDKARLYRTASFQNFLNFVEIISLVIPFTVYIIWYKTNLIKIKMNKILFACSFCSFLLVMTAWSPNFKLLFFIRFIHCCLLSIAYWANLIEYMCLFDSKHLFWLSTFHLLTSLAGVFTKLFTAFTLILFYILIGLLFLLLSIAKPTRITPPVNKIKKSNDFPLFIVARKGIRTSLTFIEIATMIAMIIPLDLSLFITNVQSIYKSGHGGLDFSIFNFLSYRHNQHIIPNISTTLSGFIIVSFFSFIDIKKVYLSFFAKMCLSFYFVVTIFEQSFVYNAGEFYLEILFFTGLSINFSLKCYDIIKGFKRYLLLINHSPELHLLFIKSFSLFSYSFIIGFLFGTMVLFLEILFTQSITMQIKTIGQFFFFIIMMAVTIEANNNDKNDDNFMMCTNRPKSKSEFVVVQTESNTLSNEPSAPIPDDETNHSLKPNQPNSSHRPTFFSSKARNELNLHYNSERQKSSQFFTNDTSNMLGKNLSPPSIFSMNTEPNNSFFSNIGMDSIANSHMNAVNTFVGVSFAQNDSGNRNSNFGNDRNDARSNGARVVGNRRRPNQDRQQNRIRQQNQEVRESVLPQQETNVTTNSALVDDWGDS